MSYILSPNMNLIIPSVGLEAGPEYAYDVNNSLTLIDQHNHSPGYGVQIPPAGLNINAALTFQNQQATNLQATVYTPQTSLSTLNALYVSGVDLYFNDGNGDSPIQITKSGAVNATSSGIVSGTASASFVTGVLVVDQSANTPANIQAGSILIGNNIALSNFVTLSAPTANPSNYTITLPTLPSTTSFLTITSSGTEAASISTSGGITRTMQAAVGQQISSSCGVFTGADGGGYTNIANLTVTITTSGRPVMLMLVPDGTTGVSTILTGENIGVPPAIKIDRDSGAADYYFGLSFTNIGGGTGGVNFPVSSIQAMDVVTGGTHTYTVSGTLINSINYAQLVAYEL